MAFESDDGFTVYASRDMKHCLVSLSIPKVFAPRSVSTEFSYADRPGVHQDYWSNYLPP